MVPQALEPRQQLFLFLLLIRGINLPPKAAPPPPPPVQSTGVPPSQERSHTDYKERRHQPGPKQLSRPLPNSGAASCFTSWCRSSGSQGRRQAGKRSRIAGFPPQTLIGQDLPLQKECALLSPPPPRLSSCHHFLPWSYLQSNFGWPSRGLDPQEYGSAPSRWVCGGSHKQRILLTHHYLHFFLLPGQLPRGGKG